MDKTDDFLTRPSRNQKGYVAVWMNSPELPPTPLSKGGEGGFLKFLANFRAKSFLGDIKSDGRGNPAGCPISGGSASRPYLPQRFTPLDTFQGVFEYQMVYL
jgi:hypothetical protein